MSGFGRSWWFLVLVVWAGGLFRAGPVSGSSTFDDVPVGHYAEDAVGWAAAGGITMGVGNNRFGLSQTLTREQMVTFLCRAYNSPCEGGTARGSGTFVDVPSGHWADAAIGWAVEQGITTGVSATRFGMGQTLNREQMVTFLYRAEGSPAVTSGTDSPFGDVPVGGGVWYEAPVVWAYNEGISGGTAAGRFGLGTTLSRGEMVLFLCRAADPSVCAPSKAPIPSGVEAGPSSPRGTQLRTVGIPSAEPDAFPVYSLSIGDPLSSPIGRTDSPVLPVFYCGPQGLSYTEEDLVNDVRFLNEVYGEYYKWQSSDRWNVRFDIGKIISAPDIPADATAYGLLFQYQRSGHACIDEALRQSDAKDIVVLAEVYPNRLCSGFIVQFHAGTTVGDQRITVLGVLGNQLTRHEVLTDNSMLAYDIILYSLTGMNFTFSAGRNPVLYDGARYIPSQHDFKKDPRFSLPPMLCLERESQGWPVGGSSPPCLRLPPDDYDVSITAGEGQVTVNWTVPDFTDGASIVGYTVNLIEVPVEHHPQGGSSYRLSSGDAPVASYEATPNELSYTFDGLVPLTRYGVVVKASSKYGTTTGELSDTVVVAAPVQVTNLNPRGFTLTWDPVPGVDEYELMGFGPYNETTQVGEDGAIYSTRTVRPVRSNTVTLGPGDIEPGTTYTISIEVCGVPVLGLTGVGCERIATATVTTPAGRAQPSAPPSGISARAGKTWVDFTWDRITEAVSYMVATGGRIPGADFYGTDDNTGSDTSTWMLSNPESGSAVTARIASLQPDTSYSFEIRSCVERSGQKGTFCGIPATVSVTTSKP